jgi:transcriptional regulator with XRE-family HTH domain
MVSLMEETPKDTGSRRVSRDGRPVRQNGTAIRVIREKDGWSQSALAQEADISQAALSQIESEKDNAGIQTLNRIARKLQIPVGAIMRGWPEAAREEDAPAETEAEDEPEAAGVAALWPSTSPTAPGGSPRT